MPTCFLNRIKYALRYRNSIEGFMCRNELRWLYGTARRMSSIVEIGSWKGRSTHALLSGCPGTVYAVDHFKGTDSELEGSHREAATGDIFDQFMKNVGEFSNLVVMRMGSLEAAAQIDRADMVFIDGDHSYESVKADIEAWLPKADKLLCGHDYDYPGVKRAVHEYFDRIEKVDSIWIHDPAGGGRS